MLPEEDLETLQVTKMKIIVSTANRSNVLNNSIFPAIKYCKIPVSETNARLNDILSASCSIKSSVLEYTDLTKR
jgi:hypothetical protein